MLYNLVLVIFLSNGVEHRVPLINKVTDNTCIDLRDQVRGQVSSLNDLETPVEYDGAVIEFVDAECVARKVFY